MYTNEEVEYLQETYDRTQESIDRMAQVLGKSRRSIIGKLSRLGIYEKKVYTTKRGELPITKAELVHRISQQRGIEVEKLAGLEKAPKEVLKILLEEPSS